MKTEPDKRDRTLGWALAILLTVNLLVLRPQAMIGLATFVVLVFGAILRAFDISLPRWAARVSLVLGVLAVLMAQGRFAIGSLGEVAAAVGALLLLRPVTPNRGLWILLTSLTVLVISILKPFQAVGVTLIIIEVATLLILAEQVYRPSEVIVSFWVSVMRSLRVIIPVGLIVTGVFWFFPNLSIYTTPVFAGFAGNDVLNPGSIAEIAQSRRVAFTAHFEKGAPLPVASNLYWRGQVLEVTQGLRWSRFAKRVDRAQFLLSAPPPTNSAGTLRYTLDLTSNRGGIVVVLDHAVFIEARRAGEAVAVLDAGAGVLSAVGAGPLTLDAVSQTKPLTDNPRLEIADGSISVPQGIRQNTALTGLAAEIFPPEANTPAKLQALAKYFRETDFRYTRRPGRIFDLEEFLIQQRRGFCEHYAAAAATLLRLAGVPTRVVTGFRGGEWNPWLLTITVRDADAHAWVEAWDEKTNRWLRFDPTAFVSPELTRDIQRELDSARWPWYRLTWSYGQAVVTQAADWVDQKWTQITSSELWENANTFLFGGFALAATIWLVRNALARRALGPAEIARQLLADLEHRAIRLHRERKPGETPLAWLRRLEQSASDITEKDALHQLAENYESGMYKPLPPNSELIASLRLSSRNLVKIWKSRLI